MQLSFFALLGSLCLSLAAEEARKGFPLYFASFEDVGAGRVESEVLPAATVDRQLTDWTRGCPADVYLLIKDSNPFQLNGLKKVQRAAEKSLTRGTFLLENTINLHELALDLEEYCEGKFHKVDPYSEKPLERHLSTQTRVYLVEFHKGDTAELKNETLTALLANTPTPFVTVIYESTFQQAHPILRNVQTSPKRQNWQNQQLRHSRENIAPIIAPLFDRGKVGHSAPEPKVDLPDNFFLTLLIGSVMAVAFMAYRDFAGRQARAKRVKQEQSHRDKAAQPALASLAQQPAQ